MYKWLIFSALFSYIFGQSEIVVILDAIDSWSDPDYLVATFDLKKGGPGAETNYVIDNQYNFTRTITNLYSRMKIVSNYLGKQKGVTKKELDSTTDMCKLFEGKTRDIYLNFMFSILLPKFGKVTKKCPIQQNSVYTYVNISINAAPIPFGKYLLMESNSLFNWMYQVKERKKYKTIMNVSIHTKLRRR